jgi:uncharacterized membrane protein HdeD (DUF308 family)
MSSATVPIARTWWMFALVGVLNVIAGLLAVTHPGFTLLALGIVLGVYLLLVAITSIVEGVTGDTESRTMSILLGVVALIAALICLRRPGESLLAIVVVLGIYLIAGGVVRVVGAFTRPGPRGLVIGVGVLDVLLGILILSLPELSLGTLAILFGISMLVRGAFDIVAGFQLRKLNHTGTTDPVPPAGAGLVT